ATERRLLVANRGKGATRSCLGASASSSFGGQHAGLIDTEFARTGRGHARKRLWGGAGHKSRRRNGANVKEVTALSCACASLTQNAVNEKTVHQIGKR